MYVYLYLVHNHFYQTLMRNFNRDELEKYQKMGKNAMKSIKTKTSFIPRFNTKNIFMSVSLSLLTYFIYRKYDHWSYKRNNYIDIFEVKRAAISQARRKDFWHKITSGMEETQYANNSFVENFTRGFESIQREIQSMQSLGDDVKIKQIVLTEYRDSKLNLGFFQLHSRESYMVINKKGDLVKKSYQIPVKLFGVPFGSKKKQATKKTVKKMGQSKMVETTARLQMALACKPINFLNTMFKQKEQQRKLLFECRQKMQQQETAFKGKIKEAVDYIPPFLDEPSSGISILQL